MRLLQSSHTTGQALVGRAVGVAIQVGKKQTESTGACGKPWYYQEVADWLARARQVYREEQWRATSIHCSK